MGIRAARTGFADRPDRSVPDKALYFELVRSLYGSLSTPKSIIIATGAALLAIAIAGTLSSDAVYGAFFLGFLIVGAARGIGVVRYHRTRHDPDDVAAIKRWELGALLGAWAFAGLVGLAGAYTLLVHPNTDLEILINCCVMGYIAGVSSRNASRPLITIGQVSATCVPFTLALLWRADIVHVALAIFIGILYVGTIIICRAVFDNIVSRHQAFQRIETLASAMR